MTSTVCNELNDINFEYNTVLQDIIKFIANEFNIPIENINGKTRLAEDIGLDGDDAVDFLEKYSDQFNVDLSNMKFDVFFGPELSFNPIYYLFYILFSKKLKPLFVDDLVYAAIKKRWPTS